MTDHLRTDPELSLPKAEWSPPSRSDLGSLIDAAFNGGAPSDLSDSGIS